MEKTVNLIDYDAGNLYSLNSALEKLDFKVNIVQKPGEISDPNIPLCIPGVGNFKKADILNELWLDFVKKAIEDENKVVGICLGMQWLCGSSTEADGVPGLNVFNGQVSKMIPGKELDGTQIKVPHVGWNKLNGLFDEKYAYFTHSFCLDTKELDIAKSSMSNYGDQNFYSIISSENEQIIGIQFHPELSGKDGLRILDWALTC
jgi:glutamine amidotransferase